MKDLYKNLYTMAGLEREGADGSLAQQQNKHKKNKKRAQIALYL